MINTYTGHGSRVRENLLRRMKSTGLRNYLLRVIVTEGKEIECKNDRGIERATNLLSGYLFIGMIMTDEAWYIVCNAPNVIGFIGSSGGGTRPLLVTEEEMRNILHRPGMSKRKVQIDFAAGDRICILNGASTDVERTVEGSHGDSQTVIMLTVLLERGVPTETGYGELEKMEL